MSSNTSFREFIKKGSSKFPPAKSRYILYVSLSCPFALRALLVRAIKGLESIIDVATVHYLISPEGWKFDKSEKPARGCTRDPIFDSSLLKELYLKANSHYEGRFTVPMLWDKQSATIVNNESADIMCMFNDEFNELSSSSNMINLRPDNFVDQIKKAQSWFMENFTGPVFQAGYAQSQKEYEEHAKQVAVSLEAIEKKLGESKFYHGDTITETDLTMFAFLIRFDPVFFVLFKCNLLAINNCPSIKRWMKSILEMPGIAQVIDMEHIKKSSYQGNKQLNPNGIVPLGNGPKELASLYDKGSINQENH